MLPKGPTQKLVEATPEAFTDFHCSLIRAAVQQCHRGPGVIPSRRRHKTHRMRVPWTQAEHDRFLQGLRIHGRNWPLVAKYVGTHIVSRVRSHAQKQFQQWKQKGQDHLIPPSLGRIGRRREK